MRFLRRCPSLSARSLKSLKSLLTLAFPVNLRHNNSLS